MSLLNEINNDAVCFFFFFFAKKLIRLYLEHHRIKGILQNKPRSVQYIKATNLASHSDVRSASRKINAFSCPLLQKNVLNLRHIASSLMVIMYLEMKIFSYHRYIRSNTQL